MALNHTVALNDGGERFATLTATRDVSMAEHPLKRPIKGYIYNAGKKKAFVNFRKDETDYADFDVERQDTVGIVPGMALPTQPGCSGFSFKTAGGHTVLYWIPGDKPPVFSMSAAMGEDGRLFVEDANARQALDDANAKLDQLIAKE